MQTAIVTGASSGIGRAVSHMLVKKGFYVYGFGRTFPQDEVSGFNGYVPICGDITELGWLQEQVRRIRREKTVSLLVNNAGVGYFGLHEELNAKKIHEMVTVNVEVPLVLTQLLLRDLKRCSGTVVNISSITAKKTNPHGCAYGATKAAISSFSASLFEEARKYGVRVTTIHPDMTASRFYRNANFCQAPEADCHLMPEEVAFAVEQVLDTRQGIAVTDVVLRPQKHRIIRKGEKTYD